MHTEYTALMSLALDGEATADEREALQGHLALCASCTAVWMQWQTWDARLKTAPMLSPASGLADRVIRRLEERKRRRLWGGWIGLGLLGIWLGLACGVLLLGGAATFWVVTQPLHAAVALSAGTHLLSGLLWPVRSFQAALGTAGLSLWTGLGGVAAGTSCLLGLWIWLVVRRGVQERVHVSYALR